MRCFAQAVAAETTQWAKACAEGGVAADNAVLYVLFI
jgi:hypothetical protein